MKPDPAFDQSLAQMRDGLPRIWYTLYYGSMQAGFTERQAFALVNSFILAQSSGGIRPDNPPTGENES